MQHTRAYSYDDQPGNHAGVYVSSHGSQFAQQYTRGYHSSQGSGQYYVQAGESINGASVIFWIPLLSKLLFRDGTRSLLSQYDANGTINPALRLIRPPQTLSEL